MLRASLVRCCLATLTTTATLAAAPALAQELSQPSPHARVEQRVGVTDFVVDYSSPGVKGRPIWGALVPYDQPWRSGANASTKLIVSTDFTFGGKPVPAGTYALYTIPGKASWTVMLASNPESNQFDPKKEVVRVTTKAEATGARERLTYIFSDTSDEGVRLDLEWEKLRISVPLKVDTKALVAKNISKALEDSWRPHFTSARWLLDNGGDLTQALGYIDTSIAIKPTWWNSWVRAQILGKQGKKADAVAAAAKAQELGKGDGVYEGFFKEQVAKSIADWKK